MTNISIYSGITKESWDKVWKDKNLLSKETNATSDLDFAFDYSYNFKTGEYENLAIKITNVPLEAFVAVRGDDYEDDNDFETLNGLSDKDKLNLIESSSLFLLDLVPYIKSIEVTLISKSTS